jgi:hypothetical protein
MTERFDEQSDEHERFDGHRGAGGDVPPGSPRGEALRVLSAVQDWAARTFPEAAADGHANGTCQWCPICQFVAVLRGDRPDVTERVVEAGTALMSAFRAFVDAAAPPGGGHPAPDGQPEPEHPRVQRIDLGDERS